MVYCPNSGKVQKHRLVKFVTTTNVEQETQTDVSPEDGDFEVPKSTSKTRQNTNVSPGHSQSQLPATKSEVNKQTQPDETNHEDKRYPSRVRKKPGYLSDFVSGDESDDHVLANCYRVMCNVPLTLTDAVTSPNSKEWVNANAIAERKGHIYLNQLA